MKALDDYSTVFLIWGRKLSYNLLYVSFDLDNKIQTALCRMAWRRVHVIFLTTIPLYTLTPFDFILLLNLRH